MARVRLAFGLSVLLSLPSATALKAQDLSEVCPNSEDGIGALRGSVSDPDVGMILPGATVVGTWQKDGSEVKTQVTSGLDGSYVLCYVPMGTEVTVQTMLGTMAGPVVAVTLTEPLTQQDLSFSMSGNNSTKKDDRIWACFFGGSSSLNLENSRIIRCDAQWKPLEQCPKTELGMVTATATGASNTGRGNSVIREMLETLTRETKRLGGNAIVNLRSSRSSIMGDAVKIDVDPKNCN